MSLFCLILIVTKVCLVSSLEYSCSFTNLNPCTTNLNQSSWNFIDSMHLNLVETINKYIKNNEMHYSKNYPLCLNKLDSSSPLLRPKLEIDLPQVEKTPLNLCFRMKVSFKSSQMDKTPLDFRNQTIQVSYSNQVEHVIQATGHEEEDRIPEAPSYSLSLSEILINEENVPSGPFQDSVAEFQMPLELFTEKDLKQKILVKGTIGACIHEYFFSDYESSDEAGKECPLQLTFPNENPRNKAKISEYKLKFDKWNRIILLNGKIVLRNNINDSVKKSMLVSTWRFDLNKMVFSALGLVFGVFFIITLACTIVFSKKQTKKALILKRMEIMTKNKNRNEGPHSGDQQHPLPSAPPAPSSSSSLENPRNHHNTFTIHSNPEDDQITRSSGSHNNSIHQLSLQSDSQISNSGRLHRTTDVKQQNIPSTHYQPMTTQQSLMQLANAVNQQNRLQSSNRLNNDSINDVVRIRSGASQQPKSRGLNRHSLLLAMNDQNEIVLKPSQQANVTILSDDIEIDENGYQEPSNSAFVNHQNLSPSGSTPSDYRNFTYSRDNDKLGSSKSSIPPPDYSEAVYMPSSCENLK